jgi:hypothetical protein
MLPVGIYEGRGLGEKSDRGFNLNGDGYGRFNGNNPYMDFPTAADP